MLLVEVTDKDKESFVSACENSLKKGWYIHIVNKDTMVVVFRGQSFEFLRWDLVSIKKAEDYGASIGILREQMGFAGFFDRPFGQA